MVALHAPLREPLVITCNRLRLTAISSHHQLQCAQNSTLLITRTGIAGCKVVPAVAAARRATIESQQDRTIWQ